MKKKKGRENDLSEISVRQRENHNIKLPLNYDEIKIFMNCSVLNVRLCA